MSLILKCFGCRFSVGPAVNRLALLQNISVRNFAYVIREQKSKIIKHPYRGLYPWKTKTEFIDHMHKNIIYKEHGVIILNKPFGVPKERYKKKDETISNNKLTMQTVASMAGGEAGYGIQDAIPGLKILLDVDYLEIVKCTERFTSGITILSSDEKVTGRIKKSLRSARGRDIPDLTFWLVAHGIPSPLYSEKKQVGIKMEFVDLYAYGENVDKQPIIAPKFSKTEVKQRTVLTTDIEYKTIKVNHEIGASLVELSTNRTKSHLVRVYAAHKALSILGDNMYGSRVKFVLGKPILISHHNVAAYDPPKLPDIWQNLLEVNKGNMNLIPTHIHLHKLFLPKLMNGEDFHLIAPPPNHFLWTCAQLGLLASEEESKSGTGSNEPIMKESVASSV